MSYDNFQTEIGRINDILCTVNLQSRDARTVVPPGGVDARGRQIATLTSLAHDMASSDSLRRTMSAGRRHHVAVADHVPSAHRRLGEWTAAFQIGPECWRKRPKPAQPWPPSARW